MNLKQQYKQSRLFVVTLLVDLGIQFCRILSYRIQRKVILLCNISANCVGLSTRAIDRKSRHPADTGHRE